MINTDSDLHFSLTVMINTDSFTVTVICAFNDRMINTDSFIVTVICAFNDSDDQH